MPLCRVKEASIQITILPARVCRCWNPFLCIISKLHTAEAELREYFHHLMCILCLAWAGSNVFVNKISLDLAFQIRTVIIRMDGSALISQNHSHLFLATTTLCFAIDKH